MPLSGHVFDGQISFSYLIEGILMIISTKLILNTQFHRKGF